MTASSKRTREPAAPGRLEGREACARAELVWHSVGEHELPDHLDWLSPSERERASALRFAKRRNDYLLARYAGKSAFAKRLGLPCEPGTLARVEVRNRTHGPERGAPEVFLDGARAACGISLTDRAGWAVCALHPAGSRVGCDLELAEPRSDAFIADYLTESEQRFVADGRGDPARFARANLLWSAKESVLKVLRTGLRRDTRSIEVSIRGAALDDWCTFRAHSDEGASFDGWWNRFGPFLLTIAVERRNAAPSALVTPPALRHARPHHRWMQRPIACDTATA